MKKKSLSLIFSLLVMLVFAVNVNAQTTAKKYVVINRANDCALCTSNYDRWNKEIMSQYTNGDVIFINNDLTSDDTRLTSRTMLDKYGLYNTMRDYTTPGSVYVIDANTGTVSSQFGIDENTQRVLNTLGTTSPTK